MQTQGESVIAAHQCGELTIRADGVGMLAKITDDLQQALLAGGQIHPGGTGPAQQPPPGQTQHRVR